MFKRNTFIGISILSLSLAALSPAIAANENLAARLQGHWSLQTALDHFDDGHEEFTWGQHPSGALNLSPGGHFSFSIVGDELPEKSPAPFIAGRRVISMTGTYTVNESSGQITLRIERSSFPGWDHIERTSTIASFIGDTLELHSARVTNAKGSWVPRNVWKRLP